MTLVLFLYIQLGKCGSSKLPSANPTSSGEPTAPWSLTALSRTISPIWRNIPRTSTQALWQSSRIGSSQPKLTPGPYKLHNIIFSLMVSGQISSNGSYWLITIESNIPLVRTIDGSLGMSVESRSLYVFWPKPYPAFWGPYAKKCLEAHEIILAF